MNRWSPRDIQVITLILIVPFIMLLVFIIDVIHGAGIPDEHEGVTEIITFIIGVVSGLLINKNKNE